MSTAREQAEKEVAEVFQSRLQEYAVEQRTIVIEQAERIKELEAAMENCAAHDMCVDSDIAHARRKEMVNEAYTKGFVACREMAERIVDESDGYLFRISALEPKKDGP